jgi:hypothetical protein
MTDQRGALGKRAAMRDNAPPPLKASLSLAETVARARAERRFTRGDYTAAQPPTTRMVVMLERFTEDQSNSIVLRHLAAGYLLCCLGSLRVGNAQHCWIPHLITDVETLAGFVCQDKNPRPGKARPRPFWVRVAERQTP